MEDNKGQFVVGTYYEHNDLQRGDWTSLIGAGGELLPIPEDTVRNGGVLTVPCGQKFGSSLQGRSR